MTDETKFREYTSLEEAMLYELDLEAGRFFPEIPSGDTDILEGMLFLLRAKLEDEGFALRTKKKIEESEINRVVRSFYESRGFKVSENCRYAERGDERLEINISNASHISDLRKILVSVYPEYRKPIMEKENDR